MANSSYPSTNYAVPLYTRIFRAILRPIFRLIFHLMSQVKISGIENVPPQGAYLIAINHISLVEPPFILAFWPVAPEAVGAVDIWARTGQSMLARLYGGIPVHRGEYDRQLIDRMISALKSGRPLVIAPEGGRSHTPGMRRARPGIAYVIDQAGIPVVPVGIVGSTDEFLSQAARGARPKIEMRIGVPFDLPPLEGRGEARRLARQKNADQIMFHIAELLPAEYRGVYSSPNIIEPDAEENTSETTSR